MRIYKGDIYYADLSPVIGCEQGGIHPVLILQNDIGNLYSPTTIVAAITSRPERNPLPTHVHLSGEPYGLRQSSIVMLEQVRTLDCSRLRGYISHLSGPQQQAVDEALAVSFGLRLALPEQVETETMAMLSPTM